MYEIERYTSVNAIGAAVVLEGVLPRRDCDQQAGRRLLDVDLRRGQYRNPRTGESGIAPGSGPRASSRRGGGRSSPTTAARAPAGADLRDEAAPPDLGLRGEQARPRGAVPLGRRGVRGPGGRAPLLQRLRRAAGALEPVHGCRRDLLVAPAQRQRAARLRGRRPDTGLHRRPRPRDGLRARADRRRRRRADGQSRHRRPDLDPRGGADDRRRARQGRRAGDRGAVPRRRHPPLLRRHGACSGHARLRGERDARGWYGRPRRVARSANGPGSRRAGDEGLRTRGLAR